MRLAAPSPLARVRIAVALLALLAGGLQSPHPMANAAPANDRFAGAATVVLPGGAAGTTVGATLESGEPVPACGVAGAGSVWFRLIPS
jgi:hypothetical protein